MKIQMLATALASCASLASFAASAQATPPAAAYDGSYVIEILPPSGMYPKPNCMAFDGGLLRTQRYGDEGLCGYNSLAANEGAKNTVWDITSLMHIDGRIAYTIRSRVNGQCMVRGHNGDENTVRFHMWSAKNPALCGFNSPEEVIEHGQAAWQFDEVPELGPTFVSNIRTLRNGVAYLSFTNRNLNAVPGQALLHSDNVFRFTRIPGSCTTNGSLGDKQIVSVCGVGDFAQPLKLEDADYLEMDHDFWSPDQDKGDEYQRYVTVRFQDAGLYCSRLRSGGFSDWREPNGTELLALYNAFPDYELTRQFGWPIGAAPYTTSDRNANNQNLTIRMFNGVMEWDWDFVPLPVACVR